MSELPEPPLRVDFHLLDRQISDSAGELVGNVDDVELELGQDGVPYVTALLSAQQVLGERIGGRLGRWMTVSARQLHPDSHPQPLRIAIELVAKVESGIVLSVQRDALPPPPLELWLREHLIGKIPGADDAGG